MPHSIVKHEALTTALTLRMELENGEAIDAPVTCVLAAIMDMMTPQQLQLLLRHVEARKQDVSAVLISGLTGNRLC